MNKSTYTIFGMIDGQEFISKNNTKEDFYKLVEMIYGFCGFVVEFVEVIR